MSRFLIYLFPMMMDVILSTLFFVCSIRLAEGGAGAFAVSMVCTLWAVTYSVSALLAGRIATIANATRLIITSCLALTGLSVLFMIFGGLQTQYFFMIVSGVLIAMFFTPFQVFMKAVSGKHSGNFSVSIGLYTFSWSLGLASGPFISGMLWEYFNSWRICHGVNALLALVCAGGIFLLRHHAHPVSDKAARNPAQTDGEYHGQHDFAMIGWICGGICCLIVALLRAVFPTLATAMQISKADQGMVLAIFFFTQGCAGLLLSFFKFWMYRATPIVLMTALGVAGLLMFGLSGSVNSFYLAALIAGIYAGASSFYIVFHALVHPSKSTRNVSVNEAVVGIAGIFGPMAGGILADNWSLPSPFIFAAVLAFAALFIQFRAHRLHPVNTR